MFRIIILTTIIRSLIWGIIGKDEFVGWLGSGNLADSKFDRGKQFDI